MPTSWFPLYLPTSEKKHDQACTTNLRLELKHVDCCLTDDDVSDLEYGLYVFAFNNDRKTVLSNVYNFEKLEKRQKKDGHGCVRLILRQTLYYHSSEIDYSTVFVFALISFELSNPTEKSEVGWCSINVNELLHSSTTPHSSSSSFLKGSCRLLYLPPEIYSEFVASYEKMYIYYSVDPFVELENYSYLIPENKFVLSPAEVPGIVADKTHNTWNIGNFVKIYIEDISVTTNSFQIADFENCLCSKVSDNLAITFNQYGTSTIKLQVFERRVKIFLHNRYTVVQPVPVIYMDTIIESERGSYSGRKISATLAGKSVTTLPSTVSSESSSKTYLVARNDAELFVPQDPNCAVVFVLDYILSEITNSLTTRKFYCTVRWATYSFDDNMEIFNNIEHNSVNLNLLLQGSRKPYKAPDSNIDSLLTSVNENMILVSDSDNYEKHLLTTVCPDGSLCFTANVRSTLDLTLNCTISVGKRKEKSENAITDELTFVTKQSELAHQIPTIEHEFSGSESITPLESRTIATVPRKKKIKPVYEKQLLRQVKKNNLTDDIKQFDDLNQLTPNLLPIPIQAQFNLYAQLLQQQQRQQQIGFFNTYSGLLNRGTLVGPYLGGIGPTIFEPIEPALPLIGPFLNQKSNDSLILLNNIHCGTKLSRATYAKLHSAGFEPIRTENGDPPFTIDPQTDIIDEFKFIKEEIDLLNQNEVIFQFLSYSGLVANPTTTTTIPDTYMPEQIYFTFQFYRFPQVKTPNLFVGQPLDDCHDTNGNSFRIIWKTKRQIDKSFSETTPNSFTAKGENKTAGYKVVFSIDPRYFKPGEMEVFFNYLIRTTMQIDVWNAKSHILIGTCMVELKHLCRQGREAVQVTYAADILHSNDNLFDNESNSVNPPDIQGCLLLRLANVGHRKEPISKEITVINNNRKKYLITQNDAVCFRKFPGGVLSDINCLKSNELNTRGVVVRAHKIESTNNELQEMLRAINTSEQKLPITIKAVRSVNDPSGVKDVTRIEKLDRLHCSLKSIEGLNNVFDNTELSKRSDVQTLITEKKTKLNMITQYRDQKKRELIELMINNATIIEHELYTSFGCTEFFEYQLKNSYNIEDTVSVSIEDDLNNLSFVIDPREVRSLKLAFGINTPTEDDLFALDIKDNNNDEGKSLKRNNVVLFLKPNETVLIPMKYEESTMIHYTKQYDGADQRNLSEFNSGNLAQMERVIQVIFKSLTYGKIISQLILHIHIQPPIIDQSFRFFHPELSFMKKILRLPRSAIEWSSSYISNNRTIQQVNQQVWVRVSDPDVLTLSNVQGEIVDLLIKVGLGKSPQIREFLISVYVEPFQIRPAYIWYWAIHSLQRVDAVTTVGQLSAPIGLLLRTDDCTPSVGSKRISVYTSHPNEVLIGTEFTLDDLHQNTPGKELTLCVASRSVYELKVKLRPKCIGKKIYQINVVDTDSQRVLRAWILCVDVKQPEITKSFNIKLPRRGINTACNKRIAYTNPYQCNKTLILETNRSDLVQFKESIIETPAGGTVQIGLHFIPQPTLDSGQIYIFINDEQGKNLETFLIIAQYY
ncbi:Nephrocystin-4 [Schistosoma japonicum]|nr:Nephrocystin-4 [Schistosoma japonicum]